MHRRRPSSCARAGNRRVDPRAIAGAVELRSVGPTARENRPQDPNAIVDQRLSARLGRADEHDELVDRQAALLLVLSQQPSKPVDAFLGRCD